MGCTVVFPASPTRQVARVLKGRLDGKPCRWRITIWYDVGKLEPEETNPRRLVVQCKQPKWLHEVTGVIEDALRDDAKNCGGVTNIKWQAVQEG